ncbi:MAG TPA: hypothetical protein VGN68_00800 [Sphingopyxis sp.]|jgi:hypothetical protein|uniref:hypothetical protein n=1 Tax=Sphingopyxis sp. TaxID=1908224 RepID=UPI002E0E28AA|nr:hypothetical protein [Sphingopyxis sp.]
MKLMIAFTALLAGVMLSSCGSSDDTLAKSQLAKIARDPESVEVRNVRRAAEGNSHVICGEWNGRNGFGGMGEWARFALNTNSHSLTTPEDDSDTVTKEVIAKTCDGTPYSFE